MRQFWMVWNVDGNAPRYQHATENGAIAEAERLARLHQGETFVVLEAIHARKTDAMLRADLRGTAEEIPF